MTIPILTSVSAQHESTYLATIIDFLDELGLYGGMAVLDHPTFLPGVEVVSGTLVIDEAKLAYPGDLLHEAGHLAVKSPDERVLLNGSVGDDPGEEMAAIAWSWAASLHLGIPPEVVFHDHGYRGGSTNIIEAFSDERYFGVPYLDWIGLTNDGSRVREPDVPVFPRMLKWLKEDSA